MLPLPGPAREGDREEIDAEDPEPGDEPRGLVDVGTGDSGIEARLGEGGDRAGDRDRGQQDKGQLEGSEQMDQSPDRRSALAIGDHAGPREGACDRGAFGGHQTEIREAVHGKQTEGKFTAMRGPLSLLHRCEKYSGILTGT